MNRNSLGKKQYLVPYLMSSHPGSTLKEAIELAEYLQRSRLHAGAGAGFLSDAVHTVYLYVLYRDVIRGRWNRSMCRTIPHEKAMQRALIQYRNPKNYDLVLEALRTGRQNGSDRF